MNPALRFAGLHAYDGHIHDASLEARTEQFEAAMAIVEETLGAIESEVPELTEGMPRGEQEILLDTLARELMARQWRSPLVEEMLERAAADVERHRLRQVTLRDGADHARRSVGGVAELAGAASRGGGRLRGALRRQSHALCGGSGAEANSRSGRHPLGLHL